MKRHAGSSSSAAASAAAPRQDGGLEPGAASDTFRCEGRSQVGHQTLFWEQRVELSHQLWANEFRVKLDLGLELQGGGRAWAPPG